MPTASTLGAVTLLVQIIYCSDLFHCSRDSSQLHSFRSLRQIDSDQLLDNSLYLSEGIRICSPHLLIRYADLARYAYRNCKSPITKFRSHQAYSMRLRGAGSGRVKMGQKLSKSKTGALMIAKSLGHRSKGSTALADYIKKKREKQIRRNQRKHREEIIQDRDEEKQLKKASDILWSAYLRDDVRNDPTRPDTIR
jgi:hypothetical protein